MEELATLADKIQEEVAPGVTPVSAVQFIAPAAAAPYSMQDEMAELRKMVAKLTTRVEELSRQSRSERRGRSKGNNSNSGNRHRQSRSPSTHMGSTQCWYHFYYGSKASKYVPPCAYSASKPQNQGNANASN